MRIGINTRLMIKGKMDGIGWFCHETVKRITEKHPEHEYYLFYDRKPSEEFAFGRHVHTVVLHPQARHPILWYLFFECSMRRAIRRYGIELLMSPDGYIPLRGGVPTLTVIHDLNFEHASGNLKKSHQMYMKRCFPQYARKATRIATVSEYSRQDIAATYGVAADKIDVVYNGSQADYHPYDAATRRAVRERYSGGKGYYIFVSTILKRKNLANLLKAFDTVRERADVQLIVVGARVWWQDELKEAYKAMRHKEDVIFVGRAESGELAHLLSSAIALVYPSYFEGFGIPIIEAFNAETPVITSNTTSMPEVAGEAALLIDPHKPEEIAEAMIRIGESDALREELIAKGRVQRERYSWDKTAERLWESMMKTKRAR